MCQIGRERETAVCLMQKFIDKGPEMQIRSVIALDHLKNYIYIEADKEAHVREVCITDNQTSHFSWCCSTFDVCILHIAVMTGIFYLLICFCFRLAKVCATYLRKK